MRGILLLEFACPVGCLLPALFARLISRLAPCIAFRKIQIQWLSALNLTEHDVKEHHRVRSRHFDGDLTQTPSLNNGKQFASPKKLQSARGLRAASLSIKRRRLMTATCGIKHPMSSPRISPSPTPSTLRQ